MRNRIMHTSLLFCAVLCSSMVACGGLLEKVEQARAAHEAIANTPAKATGSLKQSKANRAREAKRQKLTALVNGLTSGEEGAEPVVVGGE